MGIMNEDKVYYHVSEIARICHEANRALQVVLNDPTIPVTDPWDECNESTQRSALDGVFIYLNNDLTPEESHENWMDFKINDGWVWGEVKDEVKKTHPLLIPYNDLMFKDQIKDELFSAIVNVFKAGNNE
jgi:hypothetical protein